MPGMPTPHRYRVNIGRTRETRGPDALERAFAGLVILAVAVSALAFAIHPIRMAQTLDAVSLATGPETDALIDRAVHGAWPAANAHGVELRQVTGRYVTRMQAGEDGVINATLAYAALPAPAQSRVADAATAHGTLSFRPVQMGASDAPTIMYVCGYATPPSGTLADGTRNATTLPRQNLPPFCR